MNVNCECGAGYEVPTSLAGKKAKCKKCGQTFKIPKLFASSKESGSQTAQSRAAQKSREDKILANHMNRGQSLEEQVLAQHAKKQSKPDADGVKNLIIGITCMILGVIAHLAISRMAIPPTAQKAVYLIPIWLHLYGIYKLCLAAWMLSRKSRKSRDE